MANFCCPRCGHDNLQVINEVNVQTTGKNYSSTQGCLGYLLLGPLGLLCGSCGQNQQTTTTNQTYWVCPKCGNKFRDPNELSSAASKDKSCGILLAVVGVIALIISLIGMSKADGFGFLLGLSIFVLIFALVLYSTGSSKANEAESIRSGMAMHGGNSNSIFSQGSNTIGSKSYVQNSNTTRSNSYTQNTNIYCSRCGEKITEAGKFCTSCGNRIERTSRNIGANEWLCQNCGVINQNYVGTCGCGEEKPR